MCTAANTNPTNKSLNETVSTKLVLCTDPYISQKKDNQASFKLTGKLPLKSTTGKQVEGKMRPSTAKYCFLPVISAQKVQRLLLV